MKILTSATSMLILAPLLVLAQPDSYISRQLGIGPNKQSSQNTAGALVIEKKAKIPSNLSTRSQPKRVVEDSIGSELLSSDVNKNFMNKGPGEPGGGNAKVAPALEDQVFLDRYEAENSTPITFQNLAKQNPDLEAKLKAFNLGVGLKELMFYSPAASKRWVLSKLPLIINPTCVNAHLYVVESRVVACQTKEFIRIDENWFRAVKAIDRVWMLSHELLVGFLLKKIEKYSMSPNEIAEHEITLRRVNAALLTTNANNEFTHWEELHSHDDFTRITDKLSLGNLAQLMSTRQALQEKMPLFCELVNGKEIVNLNEDPAYRKTLALSQQLELAVAKGQKYRSSQLLAELDNVQRADGNTDLTEKAFGILEQIADPFLLSGTIYHLDSLLADSSNRFPFSIMYNYVIQSKFGNASDGRPDKGFAVRVVREVFKGQFGCR